MENKQASRGFYTVEEGAAKTEEETPNANVTCVLIFLRGAVVSPYAVPEAVPVYAAHS